MLFHSNPKFDGITVPVGSGYSEMLKPLVVGIHFWLCLEVEFFSFKVLDELSDCVVSNERLGKSPSRQKKVSEWNLKTFSTHLSIHVPVALPFQIKPFLLATVHWKSFRMGGLILPFLLPDCFVARKRRFLVGRL